MSVNSLVIHKDNSAIALPSQKVKLSGADKYLMSLRSKNSRRTMKSAMNQIAKLLGFPSYTAVPYHRMQSSDVNALIEIMRKRHEMNPSTINLYLSALKGVFKYCWEAGEIAYEDYLKLKTVKQLKGKRVKRNKVVVSKPLVKNIISHCTAGGNTKSIRDAAIIAVLTGCGLRREEVVSIRIDDYDKESRKFLIRGKGDKERIVPIPFYVMALVNQWLVIRGYESGALFVKVHRSGAISSRLASMSGQAIYNLLHQKCIELGIDRIHPHAMRHYFGTTLLRSGVDIVTVRDLLGHETITTTETYIDQTEETLMDASRFIEL